MKGIRNLLLGLAAIVAASTAAFAQGDYPNQRVTIIVPFGAGSVTDIMARIVADDLAKRWNQNVIVENRPGLQGTVAVAKAAPDGYTLLMAAPPLVINPHLNPKAGFDPLPGTQPDAQ